mmetsp:Transcript_19273/g.18416  ORF Transcript_19273/g.18416 Transcript_19273/m.18416 type:complete len:90 (-) Transcript_19273:546-815(-)
MNYLAEKGEKYFYNRYPKMETLARKKLFCSITNRMMRTFEGDFSKSGFPKSFQLPEEDEALEAYMKAKPKFTFIVKPSKGKGGEGITLI